MRHAVGPDPAATRGRTHDRSGTSGSFTGTAPAAGARRYLRVTTQVQELPKVGVAERAKVRRWLFFLALYLPAIALLVATLIALFLQARSSRDAPDPP